MELAPKQIEAINASIDATKRVVAVTGAAGTGKTTIIRTSYEQLREAGYTVALCAPTGKAAKRIYEATGIEAMTAHRLLEFSHPGDPDPKTGKPCGVSAPRRNRQEPLEFDFIFCDEYAMVSNDLHRSLLDALGAGCCIRMFGDDNQLAPVEEDKRLREDDSPFLKILNNKAFTSVVLDQVFRQGEDSGILANAQAILKGRYPTKNEQWTQVITSKPTEYLREYIMDQLFEHEVSYADVQNQILVPQNTTWIGTRKLNTLIQGMFHNERDPCLQLDRFPWVEGENGEKGGQIKVYVGDKVIITQNLYDLGVFNGETGKIIEINSDSGELVIDFGDREQAIPPLLLVQNSRGGFSNIDPRKSVDLGYAITVHKSQGSEFKRVIYILNKSNTFTLNRRNFYTAITRAKDHVLLLADQQGLGAAIAKKK